MPLDDRQRDAEPRARVRRCCCRSIRPSCASTIFRTIASPRPEPCGLVVKNGLKIRSVRFRRHARAVVGDVDDAPPASAAAMPANAGSSSIALGDRRNRDAAAAVERLERVDQQVREHLAELMLIALDQRQPGLDVRSCTATSPRGAFDFGQRDRLLQHVGEVGVLDLQPDRPHELEHLDDDRVGQLRFADDVGEQRLRVRRVGHLAAQQAGHHFDAGERVLQLVRDAGGHLAERRQPIAQPLALFELLDLREVLEEHHRADRPRRRRPAPATACSR